MAKVLLHSVTLDDPPVGPPPEPKDNLHQGKWQQGAYTLLRESAQNDPFKVHTLVDDPAEADIIVFAELAAQGPFTEWVRHHPLVKKYREKCFLFDIDDYSLPFLPGLYASLRKGYANPGRNRTGYYLRIDENPYIEFRPMPEEFRYLACFVGSLENHPVRAELARLASDQVASDQILVQDTSAFAKTMMFGATPEEKHQAFWPKYADLMASGAFSLCPRGRGPGSIRLFEAMRMGRCPVIIADEWVYPERVDWKACSLTVAEKDIAGIPELLAQNLHRAAELGAEARRQWEKFYAPEVRFHWLAEDCLAIRANRRMPEAIAEKLVWRYLVNGQILRRYISTKKKIYREAHQILL